MAAQPIPFIKATDMLKADRTIMPISLSGPSPTEGERRLREAQRMFRRTLASWASDLLILHGRGMRVPAWNRASRREAA